MRKPEKRIRFSTLPMRRSQDDFSSWLAVASDPDPERDRLRMSGVVSSAVMAC
jgi:hypothetical protein